MEKFEKIEEETVRLEREIHRCDVEIRRRLGLGQQVSCQYGSMSSESPSKKQKN